MPKEPLKPSQKKPFNSFFKYTSIVYQLFAAIFIGVFGGIKLDQYLHTRPWFTVILSLLGVASGLYLSLRDFINKK